MVDKKSRSARSNRRKFLTLTAAGLGSALAGCAGGDGGGGDGGDGGGGDGGDGGGGDGGGGGADTETEMGDGGGGGATSTEESDSLAGVEIDYWNIENVQSAAARKTYVEKVRQFEQDTGVRVSLNLSGYSQLSGQKWIEAWRNDDYPVVFDCEDFYFGRMFATGKVLPAAEYQDQLPDSYWDNIQWSMPISQDSYRFWDVPDPGIINIPVAMGPRNGINARTDLLEQAGYSMDDIPMGTDSGQNYEDLMSMAVDVQENSDADFGFQTFGVRFDYNDILNMWIASEDPSTSRYINEEGTATNYSTDMWKKWFGRYVDVQHEHGVTAPNSASVSDEATTQQMIGGNVAISMVEWLNYPTFRDRAPDMSANGDIQWTPMWPGESDAGGQLGFHNYGLNRKPPNVDQQRWDRKIQAGVKMMQTFLQEDFQTEYPSFVGFFSVMQNMWDKTSVQYDDALNYTSSAFEMAPKMEVGWPYHLFGSSILFNVTGPLIQQGMRQELGPEETMNRIASENDGLIEDANSQLGDPGTWSISG